MDINQIMDNPGAYGMPSFDEYKANPSRWQKKLLGSEHDKFDSVANGSQVLGNVTKKIVHEICGYRVKTLEKVEQIARDEGINLRTLNYKAAIMPLGGGWGEILVKWMPQDEINRRDRAV